MFIMVRIMYSLYKIPVKYCPRCNHIFLNTKSKKCLFCGNHEEIPPLPPRHQYRDVESILSNKRCYYEEPLPVDLYKEVYDW